MDRRIAEKLAEMRFTTDVALQAANGFDGWEYRGQWDRDFWDEWRGILSGERTIQSRDRLQYWFGPNGVGKSLASGIVVAETMKRDLFTRSIVRVVDRVVRDQVIRNNKFASERSHPMSQYDADRFAMQYGGQFRQYQETIGEGVDQRVRTVPYFWPKPLFVDETGRTPTAWGFEYWLQRLESLRSFPESFVVFISNLDPEQLGNKEQELTGTRAFTDRLFDGRIIAFAGESYRKERRSNELKGR